MLRPFVVAGREWKSLASFLPHMPHKQYVLRKLVRELSIDVVNVHYPQLSTIQLGLLRMCGRARLVTSVHGADLLPQNVSSIPQRRTIQFMLKRSDRITAPSTAYLRAASVKWPVLAQRRVDVISNGIDADELGPPAGDGANPPYILCVAALVKYKGIDVLLRAFASLAPQYPQFTLMLVSDGPDRAALTELARELGIASRVQFVGIVERSTLADLVRHCTVFVLPSRSDSESFGIAAAEAMALQRAVVVSNVGGLSELVEHERTGLLTIPNDSEHLAASLRRLLDEPELRRRLGEAAGAHVRARYTWKQTGAAYERVFREAIAGTSPGANSAEPS